MSEGLKPFNDAEQRQLVYVIDDDIAVRRSLNFLLATSGYTTWPFSCAFDFLDSLPKLSPAPILLDIRMPEIDGIDLLTELFKRSLKWPVIVITGHADIPTAVQTVKLGAFDLLEKPMNFDLLENMLGSAINELNIIIAPSQIQSRARSLFENTYPT